MGVQSLKRKMWLDIIREQKQSGMPVERFCAQKNLSSKQYWYYHRALADELESSMVLSTSSISYNNEINPPAIFHELTPPKRNDQEYSSATIIINDMKLIIDDSISDSLLRKLLETMKHV